MPPGSPRLTCVVRSELSRMGEERKRVRVGALKAARDKLGIGPLALRFCRYQ